MKCNMGRADRLLRITVGLTLIGLAGFGISGPWAWLGIMPLIGGLMGNCPAYSILGISTAKK
uniref:YgaP family membrane protein n=1 Tax=Polynucleobacter sp. TaxID=2029855 RepID=UPI004048BC9A